MIAALVYLGLGWIALALLARRPGRDRLFLYLLGGAFTVHLAVTMGLHLWAVQADAADPHRYLALRLLGSDACAHRYTAQYLAKRWWAGHGTPVGGLWNGVPEFRYLLAVWYYLFGEHPLVATGLNSLIIIPIGLAAHYLARSMGRTPAQARWLALLICVWPVGFAWSSIALREFWSYGAIFVMMALFVWAMDERAPGPGRPRFWLAAVGLFLLAFLMTLVRWYLGRVFIPVAGVVVLAGIVQTDWRRFLRHQLPRGLILYGVMTAAVALAGNYGVSNIIQSVTAPSANGQQAVTHPGDFLARYLASVRSIIIPSWSDLQEVHTESYPSGHLPEQQRVATLPPRPSRGSASPSRGSAPPSPPARPQIPRIEALQGGIISPNSMPADTEHYRNLFVRLVLFPYPWDRWPKSRNNLLISLAVVAQSVLWYVLLPGMFFGAIVNLRRPRTASILVFLWALALGFALSYVVSNLGTLYRLRDMAFLPALLFVDLRVYRRFLGWLLFWRRPGLPGERTSSRSGED